MIVAAAAIGERQEIATEPTESTDPFTTPIVGSPPPPGCAAAASGRRNTVPGGRGGEKQKESRGVGFSVDSVDSVAILLVTRQRY